MPSPSARTSSPAGGWGRPAIEAALRALEGFRRIMDSYGVVRYRAVATSAVREAANRDTFLDRVRMRTGIDVEIIDGSEENRLTYMAVREALQGDGTLAAADSLLVEVGGGSADLSFLRRGEPIHSGTYALGAIRMRQNLASWHGSHEQRVRLFRRHVQNIVEDIRREIPLREARQFIALGGDARFCADQIVGEAEDQLAPAPWSGIASWRSARRPPPSTTTSSWTATSCPRRGWSRWRRRCSCTASSSTRPRRRRCWCPRPPCGPGSSSTWCAPPRATASRTSRSRCSPPRRPSARSTATTRPTPATWPSSRPASSTS